MFTLKNKIGVTLMVLVGFAVAPMKSLATADGIETWGGTTVNIAVKGVSTTIAIPSGSLEHVIHGDGYHIDSESAQFLSAGNICDASVRFTYGYGSRKSKTAIKKGCYHEGDWIYHPNKNFPRGDACAELWAKEWRVLIAKQCHYVEG